MMRLTCKTDSYGVLPGIKLVIEQTFPTGTDLKPTDLNSRSICCGEAGTPLDTDRHFSISGF